MAKLYEKQDPLEILQLPLECNQQDTSICPVVITHGLCPWHHGNGANRSPEYRRYLGGRFGLWGRRLQWLPGYPDAEHRFCGDERGSLYKWICHALPL